MGAFVASATLAPRLAAPVEGKELTRRLESLRIAVPGETQVTSAWQVQAASGDQRQLRFEIPTGPLRVVLAELQRLTGLNIVITNEGIGEVTSPGVSGLFTPAEALAHALDGTNVTARATAPNSVTLEIRLAAESVDVTAVAAQPRPSSPKYAQPLIEVPQTIEVIPREVMEAQGVTTLSDALRNVPGISLQAGEGGGASSTTGDMFNLRGFSANNSLFVDGVRDDGLMSRDVYNLEQVEVFLGPTGSDVGRGNAAGYVNMQTKVPHAESAYDVSYGYGSGDLNLYDCRSESEAVVGFVRQLARSIGDSRECPVGRGRHSRTRHRGAQQQVGRAVGRPWRGHIHARDRLCADYASGQHAGLWHPGLGMARVPAGADDGDCQRAG